MPLKPLMALAILTLSARAQVVLRPMVPASVESPAPFTLALDGTAVLLEGNRLHRVPLSESEVRSEAVPGLGTFALPKDLPHADQLRLAGDCLYWIQGNQIHRQRLGAAREETWRTVPRLAVNWLPLEEERLLLFGPERPKEDQEKDPSAFMEVWSATGTRPLKRIPFPDALLQLHKAGLVLDPNCLMRNLGSWVFLLHLQSGLTYGLDVRTLDLREIEVPWHTLTMEDVTSMKRLLKGPKGILNRFNGDGAHDNLRMAPLDSHTLRLWSMWAPAARCVQLNGTLNGKAIEIPQLWSPHADMSVDTWNREVGLRVYDLVLEAESLRIQQVGHVKGDDPRLKTLFHPGAIPNPDGSWTSLDLWLKRRLPEPPKAPSPAVTSKK